MAFPAAALIGALGTITAGGISAISQKQQNAQNLSNAKDLADYQWRKFGSPSAQMAAYNAAGINPFAQGSVSAESPQMQVPDQQAPGLVFGSALQSFIAPLANLLTVQSQIKQMEALTEKTEKETTGVDLQNIGIELDNKLKDFDLGEIKPATLREIEQQISSSSAGEQLTRSQIKLAAETILKVQSETQGIDLKNRFQEMENDWKRRQGERNMPENLAEWQELQNRRMRQQINIDMPEEQLKNVKENMFKNFEKMFDIINSDKALGDNFMGIPLVEPEQRALFRGIMSMLLYKIMVSF